jgi:hypothetical protein
MSGTQLLPKFSVKIQVAWLTIHKNDNSSCILCRKRKIKCDRETPCGNCTKSGNVTCAYRDEPSRPRKPGVPRAAASPTATAVPLLTPSSTILAPTVPTDSRTLLTEPRLSAAPSTAQSPASTLTRNSRVETKTVCLSTVSRTVYFHAEHRSADQPGAIVRSITHKTRLFGQSHWANVMTHVSLSVPTTYSMHRHCSQITQRPVAI